MTKIGDARGCPEKRRLESDRTNGTSRRPRLKMWKMDSDLGRWTGTEQRVGSGATGLRTTAHTRAFTSDLVHGGMKELDR